MRIQPARSRGSSPLRRLVDSPSAHLQQTEDEETQPDEQPQMSVEEKLRLAQAEAEAAASASNKGPDDSQLDIDINDDIGKLRSPAKKTKVQGRPKRRKSTLSPEELEGLLGLE